MDYLFDSNREATSYTSLCTCSSGCRATCKNQCEGCSGCKGCSGTCIGRCTGVFI